MNLKDQIKQKLLNFDQIRFAMIFGSAASGNDSNLSDIDVAIYSDPSLDLLDFGRLITQIEQIAQRKVDLVELNGLIKSNNLLAYNIITNNNLIFLKDQNLFTQYKRDSFLTYFDHTFFRNKFNSMLKQRIESNRFGKKVNARKIKPA